MSITFLAWQKNDRLKKEIAEEMKQAEAQFGQTQQPARIFKEFRYQTLKSWSRERRVIGKAEYLEKGANPRFVVTSLSPKRLDARATPQSGGNVGRRGEGPQSLTDRAAEFISGCACDRPRPARARRFRKRDSVPRHDALNGAQYVSRLSVILRSYILRCNRIRRFRR